MATSKLSGYFSIFSSRQSFLKSKNPVAFKTIAWPFGNVPEYKIYIRELSKN
jgi:hypothetical protein